MTTARATRQLRLPPERWNLVVTALARDRHAWCTPAPTKCWRSQTVRSKQWFWLVLGKELARQVLSTRHKPGGWWWISANLLRCQCEIDLKEGVHAFFLSYYASLSSRALRMYAYAQMLFTCFNHMERMCWGCFSTPRTI